MSETLPDRIVLFDGDCAVCDATVKWFIAHDPAGKLAYAPLQGPTARAIRTRHPEWPQDLDSIVFVRRLDGREQIQWYSDGFFSMLAELPGAWRHLAALRLIPRPIRDLGYRLFARYRKRVFGTAESCRLPTEDEARRLLD